MSRCLDYLIERRDVDEHRIAIYGDGLGASFASRAAALDHRFSAAVCDAGLWDLREAIAKAAREANERESQSAAVNAQRRADLHLFADDFEAAVGSIVENVSTSAIGQSG